MRTAGGAWTGAELGTRSGLTPATLHRRWAEHRILFWRDAQEAFHYPKWQFTPKTRHGRNGSWIILMESAEFSIAPAMIQCAWMWRCPNERDAAATDKKTA